MSHVICHMSHAMCHVLLIFCGGGQGWELVGGWYLFNRAYPIDLNKRIGQKGLKVQAKGAQSSCNSGLSVESRKVDPKGVTDLMNNKDKGSCSPERAAWLLCSQEEQETIKLVSYSDLFSTIDK